MKNLIKRVFAPWVVAAYWDGHWVHHLAWSRREALAWMAAYPSGVLVVACNDLTGIVAGRK